MLPKWDNSYSVHNARIDDQHKKLFELAAEVERISDRPVCKSDVKNLLAEFFTYMKNHFNDEEKYMQMIGYPNYEEHKKIHKEIIQMMIDLIKDIRSTNDLKEKLYVIAKQWLLGHILYEDMKVEKWRKSSLSTDEGDDASFEEVRDIVHEEEICTYLYSCNCKGKVHDVPYGIHNKIQNSGANFTCKVCKQPIKFYKKH
ncbi:bacteriohemerythrin [Campylobacter sp. US33a]|uniref:Bacteriohemerythrin n=1 Tax=Campylobacter sp. CCS1377 TaxID=3158229 RepID=A0AAU7E5I9_9BACT|nr:bacteriohemerythrin [Campylobacter sp. US33a]TEY02440.1 hemerythrin family non-heme iron protein [Campylobacter sp. US33a]